MIIKSSWLHSFQDREWSRWGWKDYWKFCERWEEDQGRNPRCNQTNNCQCNFSSTSGLFVLVWHSHLHSQVSCVVSYKFLGMGQFHGFLIFFFLIYELISRNWLYLSLIYSREHKKWRLKKVTASLCWSPFLLFPTDLIFLIYFLIGLYVFCNAPKKILLFKKVDQALLKKIIILVTQRFQLNGERVIHVTLSTLR